MLLNCQYEWGEKRFVSLSVHIVHLNVHVKVVALNKEGCGSVHLRVKYDVVKGGTAFLVLQVDVDALVLEEFSKQVEAVISVSKIKYFLSKMVQKNIT